MVGVVAVEIKHGNVDKQEFELTDFYVGYWCFETALVVALYDVDDTELCHHPCYPADLAAQYRASTTRR